MRSHAATDSKRPRSRRTPLATLLALLALGTAGQALAPAGAAAMTNQPTPTLCALIGGSWLSGGCFIEDGSGGTIRVNEISVGAGRDPAPGPACVFCNLPQQIGDGAGRGGEVAKPDPKRGLGVRPEASGKKPAKKDKPKPKGGQKKDPLTVCTGLLRTAKTYKDSIPGAKQALHALYAKGTGDANALMKAAGYKALLEKLFAQTVSAYMEHGDCLALTGQPPELPK